MTVFTATPATSARYELGEGILWDDHTGLVHWVDIWKGDVLSGRVRDGLVVDITAIEFGQTVGAVALAGDSGLLVAAARGLAVVGADGTVSIGPDLLGGRTHARWNDGTVDPQGRFVVGSVAIGAETGTEVLVRVSPDGATETLRRGIRLSNGIAFAPDGATIYHVDTLAGTVSRHSYGPGSFQHAEPWVPVVAGFAAMPDGLTISADGSLWVAHWGGGCIRRHSPTGELLDVVQVAATQTTCASFVGPDLDILAITTAREGPDARTEGAGAVFLAQTTSTGLLPHRWGGSTTTPYWHRENGTDV